MNTRMLPVRKLNRSTFLAAAIVVTGGAALRLNGIGVKCLWCDEALSYCLATFSFGEIIEKCSVQSSTHPPLYFLLLRLWMLVFGDSETALRMPAAICGILALPLAYILIRNLIGPNSSSDRDHAALLYTALIAVNPMAIFASRQIRGYSFGVLFWLIGSLALASAMSEKRVHRWLLAVFAVAAAAQVFIHHVCALMVVAQCVFLVSQAAFRGSKSTSADCCFGVRTSLVTCACIVLLIAPVTFFATKQAAVAAVSFERIFSWKEVPTEMLFSFTGTFARRWKVDQLTSTLFCAGLVAILAFALIRGGKAERYFSINATLPLLLMLLYSVFFSRMLIHTRYLIFPTTASLGVIAAVFIRAKPSLQVVAGLVVANTAIIGLLKSWDSIGPDGRPGMRSAAEFVMERSSVEEIVYTAGPIEYFRSFYYFRNTLRPKLLMEDSESDFWGRRYVRPEDIVDVSWFRDNVAAGSWVIAENHKLSLRLPVPGVMLTHDDSGNFPQEFRWEHPIMARRVVQGEAVVKVSEGGATGSSSEAGN